MRKPQTVDTAVCPASAFIDTKDYVWKGPVTKSDKEFHANVAEPLSKYPMLLNSYDTLLSCWRVYHPAK